MFGPSLRAWSGCTSRNSPSTPTATAARARGGHKIPLAAGGWFSLRASWRHQREAAQGLWGQRWLQSDHACQGSPWFGGSWSKLETPGASVSRSHYWRLWDLRMRSKSRPRLAC
jgi:hypothetical protein